MRDAISTPQRTVWKVKASKQQPLMAKRGAMDVGKKIKGRKRHVLVDTLGLLLVVVVTSASAQDRDGVRLLFRRLTGDCKKLLCVWADGDYRGTLLKWVADRFQFALQIVLRSDDQKGFKLLPSAGSRNVPSLG